MKYNLEEIKRKAEYCLNCKNKPCTEGCPLSNNIPEFIKCINEGKIESAVNVLSGTTIFEPICGRICPHESQCEGKCIRGIKGNSTSIGEIETFIGDYMLNNNISKKELKHNGKTVAIIGSGPSGLACSYILSQNGYKVNLYEKHPKLGGILRYGIPDFRLEKNILDDWIEKLVLNENIKVYTNMELGKDFNLEELKEKNDFVVLAFGANISSKIGIEGEEKEFIIGGNELLEYRKFPDLEGKKVIVLGGGNVAIDAARTIKRLNAKNVTIVYRRAEEQMPAEKKEIEEAKREKIEFLFQTNIVKVIDNNNRKIECIKTKLVAPEDGGRKYPVDIEGTNFYIEADYIVKAIGSMPDKNILNKLNLNLNKWGYIEVDKNYMTSNTKVYAIGDIAGTKKTVAWAARTGFECAKKIIAVS